VIPASASQQGEEREREEGKSTVSEKCDEEQENVRRRKSPQDVLDVECIVEVCSTGRRVETEHPLDEDLLLGTEETGGGRAGGKDEEHGESGENSDTALQVKNEPPPFLSTEAVHLENCSGEKSRESTGEGCGGEEETDASLELLAAVEHGLWRHEMLVCINGREKEDNGNGGRDEGNERGRGPGRGRDLLRRDLEE
jgi:hypothetical protein